MVAPVNQLKAALKSGALQKGLWLNLGSDAATEIAGFSGADWCLIDGEHGPFDLLTIQRQLRILAGTPADAVVRVPDSQAWMLKQVLDIGAQTIVVPMVDTAEEAASVVAACRYPPAGIRGSGALIARAGRYGGVSDYAETAADQLCLFVQAESRAAFDNLDDIMAVDGIDGIFVGPSDLAADMGYLGAPGPEVAELISDAIPRIRAAGLSAGIITADPEADARYVALGVNFLGVASDAALLNGALRGAMA